MISVGRISAYTELLQRVVLGVSDSEYHQLQRVVVLFVVCPDFLFTVSCVDILTGIHCDLLKCSEVWWLQHTLSVNYYRIPLVFFGLCVMQVSHGGQEEALL